MKVNGHNDPPVFNHKDVKINPSSSDSELDMNVSYQPVLPPDSPQSRLIAEIDHPEMDIDYLFTRSSRSDTQIKTVSISPNISPKKLIQDSIQEQIETLEPDEEVTFSNQNKKVSIKPECVSGENDVKPKHQHNNDLIKSDCTSCEAMMDLLHQMNNKFGQLEQKLDQQVNSNNELLSTFLSYQNDQKILQNQKDKELDEMKLMVEILSSCCNFQLNEIDMKCNNLCGLQSQLSYDIDDIKYRQKDQQSNIENIAHSVRNAQQLFVDTQDSMRKTLSKQIVKELEITTYEKSQTQNITNKSNNGNINSSDPSSSNSEIRNSSITNQIQNEKKPDLTNKCSEHTLDDTGSESEYIFQFHPASKDMKKKIAETDKYKQKFKLHNSKSKNILLGDSNMKSINRVRLDNSKNTEVRTYRGASIKTLTDIIKSSETVCPLVEKVTLCIGSIDCARRYIDGNIFHDDYLNLLAITKHVFPSATICLISIPPQRSHHANKVIHKMNGILASLAKKMDCTYRHCEALWFHVNNKGEVDDGILVDSIHLTPWGIGLLLQPIISFFFGHDRRNVRNRSQERPQSPDETFLSPSRNSSTTTTDQNLHTSQQNDMKAVTDYFVRVLSSGLQSLVDQLKSPNPVTA